MRARPHLWAVCDLSGLKPGRYVACALYPPLLTPEREAAIDHAWPKTVEKSSTSLKLPLHRSDTAARGDQPGFSNLHGFLDHV
jgi:hypothetical protein